MDRRIQTNPCMPPPLAAGHAKLQRHNHGEVKTEHKPCWKLPSGSAGEHTVCRVGLSGLTATLRSRFTSAPRCSVRRAEAQAGTSGTQVHLGQTPGP